MSIQQHIESSPERCSGRPRIAGTRVRVQDIVACHEFHGMTADEIVDGYPHITLADVYAALAYYHDYRDEIRGHMKQDEDFVARFKAEYLAKQRGKDDYARSRLPRSGEPKRASQRNCLLP